MNLETSIAAVTWLATIAVIVARIRDRPVLCKLAAVVALAAASVFTVSAILRGDLATMLAAASATALAGAVLWTSWDLATRVQARAPEPALAELDAVGFAGAGMVGEDAARVWFRSPHAGVEHVVQLFDLQGELLARARVVPREETDGTTLVRVPDELSPRVSLSPGRTYFVRVASDAGFSTEARFHTAPCARDESPQRFSFAVLSCHQPYGDDGRISDGALELLRALPSACEARAVRRVLLLGDQIYADLPESMSLYNEDYFRQVGPEGVGSVFECTPAQVRRLWHQRHRMFWKFAEMQALQSRWATHLILDDHEIVDNFGSAEAHGAARWASVRAGALEAIYDYQGVRCVPRERGQRPPRLSHSFRYGPVLTFVADLRCERRVEGEVATLMGEAQFEALEAALREHDDAPIVIIALSVPVLHLPAWAVTAGVKLTGEGSDIDDRWSAPSARGQRTRLLTIAREWIAARPGRRMLLLGGDVHVGLLTRIRWPDGVAIYSLVSSAISNPHVRELEDVVRHLPTAPVSFEVGDDAVEGELVGRGELPYAGLNAGFVHVSPRGDGGWSVELEIVGTTQDQPGHATTLARFSVPEIASPSEP